MAKWTLPLLIITVFTNGLLSGGNFDRLLVATPAWKEVGLRGWADFSRAADLGNGQIVYPLLAIGSTVLAFLAVLTFLWTPRRPPAALVPVGLSAVFMIIALPFSLKAVPFMQSLRTIGNGDVAGLGRAFGGAHFWGSYQGYFHLAAFCCQIWALVAVARLTGKAAKAR